MTVYKVALIFTEFQDTSKDDSKPGICFIILIYFNLLVVGSDNMCMKPGNSFIKT